MQQVLRRAWYVGALPHEIGREPIRRTLLGEHVLLFRSENGEAIALQDRCPHRFAPLSRGKLIGDIVQCGYHGLEFDRKGNCVRNPHSDIIAPNAKIRSYPVVERFGLTWIWMGAPERATADSLPDLSYMADPALKTVHSYLHGQYRYDILVDNLLDLSHGDYLHVGTFSGGQCASSETRVSETSNVVQIIFTQFDAPTSPLASDFGNRVDQRFSIKWHPGNIMCFELSIAPAGSDLKDTNPIRFSHIVTPETDNTTHYFMSVSRDTDLHNAELDAQMRAHQLTIIQNEDGPMLEAINGEMGNKDLLEMHPAILPTDKGAIRVRSVIRRMLADENIELKI